MLATEWYFLKKKDLKKLLKKKQTFVVKNRHIICSSLGVTRLLIDQQIHVLVLAHD